MRIQEIGMATYVSFMYVCMCDTLSCVHIYIHIYMCMHIQEIVKANNLDDKITLIQGKVEEISLPVEQVRGVECLF